MVRTFFETLWFIRVPVLSLVVLALFGFAASGALRQVLGGLFDLEGDGLGMFYVDVNG